MEEFEYVSLLRTLYFDSLFTEICFLFLNLLLMLFFLKEVREISAWKLTKQAKSIV